MNKPEISVENYKGEFRMEENSDLIRTTERIGIVRNIKTLLRRDF